MKITKRKVVNSVCKIHKQFFINISTYRDLSVYIRPLFIDFRPVKFRLRDRAPPNSMCIKRLYAPSLCPKF